MMKKIKNMETSQKKWSFGRYEKYWGFFQGLRIFQGSAIHSGNVYQQVSVLLLDFGKSSE